MNHHPCSTHINMLAKCVYHVKITCFDNAHCTKRYLKKKVCFGCRKICSVSKFQFLNQKFKFKSSIYCSYEYKWNSLLWKKRLPFIKRSIIWCRLMRWDRKYLNKSVLDAWFQWRHLCAALKKPYNPTFQCTNNVEIPMAAATLPLYCCY